MVGAIVALFRFDDIPGFPALADHGLGRAVEPNDREIAFSWNSREPIRLPALRRFWAEIKIRAAVGVLDGLIS